jgi:hypothetical protein
MPIWEMLEEMLVSAVFEPTLKSRYRLFYVFFPVGLFKVCKFWLCIVIEALARLMSKVAQTVPLGTTLGVEFNNVIKTAKTVMPFFEVEYFVTQASSACANCF